MIDYGQYLIRYAAGVYWIVKKDQKEAIYIEPLPTNESGAMIWEWLAGGHATTDIADKLHKKYGIGYEEAYQDVEFFLNELSCRGLV